MRRPRRKLEVNTFPFLAVLLCAMGSFILLLMVIDRRAKIVSQNKARDAYLARKIAYETEHAAAVDEANQRNDKHLADWQAQKEKIHADLKVEEDAIARDITQLLAALAKTEDRVGGEKAKANSLAEKVSLEDVALKALQKELLARQNHLERAKQAGQGHLKLREQLTRDLALLEAALRNVRERKSRERPVYSLVPYKGKHGANTRPVYIEVSERTVAVHPGPTTLTAAMRTPDNLRRAIEERTGPLEKEVVKPGQPPTEHEKTPYLLFLVRPSGITSYYESLQALRGYRVDFGYELIEPDWVFDFSTDKMDEQPWRNVAKLDIEPPNVTRPAPKGLGPREIKLGGGEASFAPGGTGSGIGGENGGSIGRVGISNGPGQNGDPRGSGLPGGVGLGEPGTASGPGQILGGTSLRPGGNGDASGPGGGALGGPGGGFAPGPAPGNSPGGISNATDFSKGVAGGSGRPFGQTPGSGGNGSGNAGGQSRQFPGGAPGSTPSGIGVAGTSSTGQPESGSGIGQSPSGVSGSFAANSANGTGVPGSQGVPGGFGGSSPSGQAGTVGGTGSAGSPSNGTGGGDPSQPSSGQPNPTGNNPGTGQPGQGGGAGSQNPAAPNGGGGVPSLTFNLNGQNPDQPPGARTEGSPPPSDNPLTFRNASPSSNSPGVANNPGGGAIESGEPPPPGVGRPRAPGDPDDGGEPGPRVGNSPFLPSEKGRSGPRLPALGRITGNRDFVLTVDCFDNKVTLTPPGRVFDLKTPDATQQLANLMKNLVDRRQASVRPGEPPYRPLIHFRVQPDGRRTYYSVYPRLAEFGFPMSRETPD